MKQPTKIYENLIAPCGMNCALCMAYQRQKNHCPGCNGPSGAKPKSCSNCVIVNCEKRAFTTSGFCYECPSYPCRRLKQLDKRYRTKYKMSMLENLEFIKEKGLGAFTMNENNRWACPSCGKPICVHRGFCIYCGS